MRNLTEVAPGVLMTTSSFDLTTSTVVAGAPGECLLIDPAVSPADLAGLAAALDGLGLRPAVAWATHPHWDHVLWSRELGDAPRYATPAAARATQAGRDHIVEQITALVPGLDLSLAGQVTPLDAAAIAWDGPEARLVVHDAHAPGHGAVFLPGPGVLIAGDMCSDVEIPLLDLGAADPLGEYRTGLGRLAAVAGVRQVVPGHGHPGDAAELARRITADRSYLDELERGRPFTDPRLTPESQGWLHETHAQQLGFFRR